MVHYSKLLQSADEYVKMCAHGVFSLFDSESMAALTKIKQLLKINE